MTRFPPIAPNLTQGAFVYTDHSGQTQTMHFQFNPETLKRSRSAQFKETKANDTQGTTNARGAKGKKYTLTVERWTIELDIRLDTSYPPPPDHNRGMSDADRLRAVQEGIKHLETLIEPGPIPSENDSLYGYQALPDPPLVGFLWGNRQWNGFVTSLSISEVQFTRDLVPRRVEASVSLVQAGERLDQIAFRYYGDPLKYWLICDANDGSSRTTCWSRDGS